MRQNWPYMSLEINVHPLTMEFFQRHEPQTEFWFYCRSVYGTPFMRLIKETASLSMVEAAAKEFDRSDRIEFLATIAPGYGPIINIYRPKRNVNALGLLMGLAEQQKLDGSSRLEAQVPC